MLLPIVEESLGRLASACDSLRNSNQVLTLRLPPTLATRWFLPLLASVHDDLANLDVRVTTYDAWQPRFEDSDIDAAIIHGHGEWPRSRSHQIDARAADPRLLRGACEGA